MRVNIMRNITVNYDYHKEAEQMRKEKNITFYDDRYEIGDKRRFDLDKEILEILKETEKELFDKICQYYSREEQIIEHFKEDVNWALTNTIQKSNENGQEFNLLDIKVYITCLDMGKSDYDCYG